MLDIPSDYIRVLQDINYSQTESLFIDEFFDKNNQEVKEKFVCLASYFPFERLSDADYNEIQSHGENIATYTLINLFNESPNLIKHVILDQEILEETDLSTFAKFFAEHGNKLKQESIANFIKNNEEYIGRLQTLLTESDNPASKQIKAHSVPVTQQVEKSADPINELQQHSESPPDTRVEELAMAIEEQANRIEKEQRRLPKWLQNAKANIKMDDLRALAKTTRAGKATVLTTEQWGTVTKQTARFGFCENKESDTESALSNYRPS